VNVYLPVCRCMIHDRVKVCGKWYSRQDDEEIRKTIEKNERDIRWEDMRCDKCWSERIPP
jgi:hypothetical protein